MSNYKRSDDKYLQIEKFKDYETTQCIAYEMAVRNPEIKALVNERNTIDIFGNLTQSDIDDLQQVQSYEQVEKFMKAYFKNNPKSVVKFSKENELDDKIKKLSYFKIPSIPDKMSKKLLVNPFFEKYLTNSSQRQQALHSTIIRKEGLGIKKMFDDTVKVSTIHGSTIDYASLFPKFSRPLPEIPTETNKQIDLLLNLALPTKDLTALVETIKNVYDKSKGSVFSVPVPLEVVTEIDKDIFAIQIKTKKKGSPTKLEMPDKTSQEVYADLFFLYDVYTDSSIKKQSDKYFYFHRKLIDYYATKVCKYHGIKDIDDVSDYIGTPNEHTTRKYFKMMKSYIDEYGYKSLLT